MKVLKIAVVLLILSVFMCGSYFGYLFYLNGKPFSFEGNVKILKSGKTQFRDFDKQDKLEDGDIVKTGKNSNVELILGNTANIIVKAEENTEVRIIDKKNMKLELVSGEMLAALTRPTRLKKFTVKTPNAVCGVRGTGWRVSFVDEPETVVEVFEGRVTTGKDYAMYENDPYIAHDADKLEIENEAGSNFIYKKLGFQEYPAWNNWLKVSSKKLSKMFVINHLVGSKPDSYPVWQEGVTFASWYSVGYQDLEADLSFMKMENDTNASWVNIITTWYQSDINSAEIWRNGDKTPTDESLEYIFKKAQRKGMHIMFSPFVDLIDSEGDAWRAEIGFRSEENWDAWFESYKNYLLYCADLAQRNNIEILNIGTELSNTTIKRPDKWIELIREIRKVYDGKLVYTANWFEEYKEVTFWQHLDYAGISAYFPVAIKDKPFYWEIKRNMKLWAKEIEAWQKTHGKPVLFTEIGYRSIEGSAKEPWDYSKGGPVDLKQQYNCYKAALSTFWGKEWFYGYYWWSWRTKAAIQGKYHRGYTPNDKPASELLDKWYSKPDPHKYKSLFTRIKEKIKLVGS